MTGRIMQPEINLLTDESLTHMNLSYEGDRAGSFIAARKDGQNRLDGSPGASSLVAFARLASSSFTRRSSKTFPASTGGGHKCGDRLACDDRGRGFTRHLTKPDCDFERGEKDK